MHELYLLPLLLLAQVEGGLRVGDGPAAGNPRSSDRFQSTPYASDAPQPNVGQRVLPASAYGASQTNDDAGSGRAASPAATPIAAGGPSAAGRPALPLAPRGKDSQRPNASGRTPPSTTGTIINIVSSLAIVLGLFFLVAWLMRRGSVGGAGELPSDVVRVLGRAALAPRQQMQLVRVGGKLLLVAVSQNGAQTLTEVTDADEVQRLAAACEATPGGGASNSFRQVLAQLGGQRAVGGFFGGGESAENGRGARRAARGGREEAHA